MVIISQGSTLLQESTISLQDIDISTHEAVYDQEAKLEEVKCKYDDVEYQSGECQEEARWPRRSSWHKFDTKQEDLQVLYTNVSKADLYFKIILL